MLNSKSPSSHLVKLVQPGPEWRILVTAGDNISAALAFAPYVNHVTLACPTARQAQEVEEATARACLSNIVCDIHDPECLPYADDSFDLLVCHHTTHTLHDADAWLLEAVRILRPQGLMAVETYLVPGTRLRGKKARKLEEGTQAARGRSLSECVLPITRSKTPALLQSKRLGGSVNGIRF
jgi:SAM-dependent methyltransferase